MIEPVISYLLGNCSCSTETQYLAFDSDRCDSQTDRLTHKRIHDEAEASWKLNKLSYTGTTDCNVEEAREEEKKYVNDFQFQTDNAVW